MKSALTTPFAFSQIPAGDDSLIAPAGEMWSVVIESPKRAIARAPRKPISLTFGCISKPSKKGGSAM